MMKNKEQAKSFKLTVADKAAKRRVGAKESNDPIYLNLHPLWKVE